MEMYIGKTLISLVEGDITEQNTEAIVNAANSSLMGGGGVDGAIHKKGGPQILKECKKIRLKLIDGLPTGQAVITSAGNLEAKYVIHTVGPVWQGGKNNEKNLLIAAYNSSLELAVKKNIRSIAFPSISTGTYSYPVDKACRIAASAVSNFIINNNDKLDEVRFVLFSERDYLFYKKAWRLIV